MIEMKQETEDTEVMILPTVISKAVEYDRFVYFFKVSLNWKFFKIPLSPRFDSIRTKLLINFEIKVKYITSVTLRW